MNCIFPRRKKRKKKRKEQTNKPIFFLALFCFQVHWSRSYKRVSHSVCSNKDEITTFQHLASKIEAVKEKEEVLLLFDVLAGQKHVSSAAAFITDKKLREGTPLITNSSWKKAKAWKEWWTRERHLRKH